MSEKHGLFNFSGESPFYQLFISIMIVLSVGFVLAVILISAGTLILGSNLRSAKATGTLSDNDIVFIRYVLIIQDISFLFIPGIISHVINE